MAKALGRVPAVMRGRRQQKHKKGSSTSGKSKGLVPMPEQRVMARRGRSYKWQGYPAWCAAMDKKRGSGQPQK